MAGINSGMLNDAYPLSADEIKRIEDAVLNTQETFAYLDEEGKLNFALGFAPALIRDLAWHNANELFEENGLFIKKVYEKTGVDTFTLSKTLQKTDIDGSWGDSSTDAPAPGLYQAGAIALYEEQGASAVEGMMVKSWDELVNDGTVHVDNGSVYTNVNTNNGTNGSANVLVGDLVLPNEASITNISGYAFAACNNLTGIIIPNSVTNIDMGAFYTCSGLTSVTIPSSVTNIGEGAFNVCTSLTNVIIGDGVATIGGYAFGGCTSLMSVAIPSGVTSIDNGVFYNCSGLMSVIIPNGVTSIGSQAFYGCINLTSVVIPNGVTSIGDYAFTGCYKLVDVINRSSLNITVGSYDYGQVAYYAKQVHDGESKIVNKNNYLFYTYDGLNCLLGYMGDGAELTLPVNYNGESYEIHQYAFIDRNNLTSIVIPDSVTNIGDKAFQGCNIITATMPTTAISSIPKTKLTTVVLTSGESIDYQAFFSCGSLISVAIPNSVTSIGEMAFLYCDSLTSFIVDNDNTAYQSIDGNLYSKDGKTLIAYAAGKNDTSFAIPSSVTNIGDYAFSHCEKLANIVIPYGVTSIGKDAFSGCYSLTSIEIPNSVTSIGDSAFESSSFTSITIPGSVTDLGDKTFRYSYNLENIIFEGTIAQWESITKGYSWNSFVPATYVQCTDGQVTLS